MSQQIRRWDGRVFTPSPSRAPSLDDARAVLEGWDLSAVAASLQENLLPWEHQWAPEHVEFAEAMYRRWMFLARKRETSAMPPTHDIDGFWHAHILHTDDYASFCDQVFGYFLPHNGGYGGKDDQEFADLQRAHARMLAFYEDEYGEPLYEMDLGQFA